MAEARDAGARVLVAESRQMPFCRSAFREAYGGPNAKLRAVPWQQADDGTQEPGGVAVGGTEGEAPPMWLLDSEVDVEVDDDYGSNEDHNQTHIQPELNLPGLVDFMNTHQSLYNLAQNYHHHIYHTHQYSNR